MYHVERTSLVGCTALEGREGPFKDATDLPMAISVIEKTERPLGKSRARGYDIFSNPGPTALVVVSDKGKRYHYWFDDVSKKLNLIKTNGDSLPTFAPLDMGGAPGQAAPLSPVNALNIDGLCLVAARSTTQGLATDVLYSIQPSNFDNARSSAGARLNGGLESDTLNEYQRRNVLPTHPEGSAALIWTMAAIQPVTDPAAILAKDTRLHNDLIEQHNRPSQVVLLTSSGTFMYTHERHADAFVKKLKAAQKTERGVLSTGIRDAFGHDGVQCPELKQHQANAVEVFLHPEYNREHRTLVTELKSPDRLALVRCREAVASAIAIASSPSAAPTTYAGPVTTSVQRQIVSPDIKRWAREALIKNGGKPLLVSGHTANPGVKYNVGVSTRKRPVLSCRYDGLCQYFSRVLRSVWDSPIVVASQQAGADPQQWLRRTGSEARQYNKKVMGHDSTVELGSSQSNQELRVLINQLDLFHTEIQEITRHADVAVAAGYGHSPADLEAWLEQTSDDFQVARKLDSWEFHRIYGLGQFVELVLEVLRLWALLCEDDVDQQNGNDRFKRWTGSLPTLLKQELAHKSSFHELFDKMVDHTHNKLGHHGNDVPAGLYVLRELIKIIMKDFRLSDKFLQYSDRLRKECPLLYNQLMQDEETAIKSLENVDLLNAQQPNQKQRINQLQTAERDFRTFYHRSAEAVLRSCQSDPSQQQGDDLAAFWKRFGEKILNGNGKASLDTLKKVCQKFVEHDSAQGYKGMVRLVLFCANIAKSLGLRGHAILHPEQRECYAIISEHLNDLGNQATQDDGQRERYQEDVIQTTLSWTDGTQNQNPIGGGGVPGAIPGANFGAVVPGGSRPAGDRWAHIMIFDWHIEFGYDAHLTKDIPSPFLEGFLKAMDPNENGGFKKLSYRRRRQLLLVDFYKHRRRYMDAARVYFAMASAVRRPDDDDDGVRPTLQQRRDDLSEAVLNGQSSDPSEDVVFLQKLNDHKEIAEIQQQARQYLVDLQTSGPPPDSIAEYVAAVCPTGPAAGWADADVLAMALNGDRSGSYPALRGLDSKLFEITPLYNEYLVPWDMYAAQLNALVTCNAPEYSTRCPELVSNIIEVLHLRAGDSVDSVVKGLVRDIGPHVKRSWWFDLNPIVQELEDIHQAILQKNQGNPGGTAGRVGSNNVLMGLLEAGFQHEKLFVAYREYIQKHIDEHDKFKKLHMHAVICQLFEDWYNSSAVRGNDESYAGGPSIQFTSQLSNFLNQLNQTQWNAELDPQARQWVTRFRTLTQR